MAPIVAPLIRRPAACPVSTCGATPRGFDLGSGSHPLIRFDEFMAKKTRKQKQRAATRRPGAPARAAPAATTRDVEERSPRVEHERTSIDGLRVGVVRDGDEPIYGAELLTRGR